MPVASFLLGACAGPSDELQVPRPPVEVGVITLQAKTVLLTRELPGRTLAYETSEVRPQVSGIIRARLFTEGQRVEKGQALYSIDSRLYRAAAAQARANLAGALAQRRAARSKAERYASLASARVASEQDYADAQTNLAQAAAAVQQARAALDTAKIHLQFTEVQAPISGRIGRSLVTAGALVTASQPEPLATIARLDRVFVDLQESSVSLLPLRRSLAKSGTAGASADVQLKLEDGSDYGKVGKLHFAESSVDPNTGSVTLRASFDNPDGLLLPGMYVRAIVGQAEERSAVLAPQSGVVRDAKGNARALLVDKDDRVVQQHVELNRIVDDQWLISKGLAPGDRLIVQGTDKVKPGQTVKTVPVVSDLNPARLGYIAEP